MNELSNFPGKQPHFIKIDKTLFTPSFISQMNSNQILINDGNDGNNRQTPGPSRGQHLSVPLHISCRIQKSLQFIDQVQITAGKFFKCSSQSGYSVIRDAAQQSECGVVIPKIYAIFCAIKQKRIRLKINAGFKFNLSETIILDLIQSAFSNYP